MHSYLRESSAYGLQPRSLSCSTVRRLLFTPSLVSVGKGRRYASSSSILLVRCTSSTNALDAKKGSVPGGLAVHRPTCWCASLPQSCRHHAQNPQPHLEQVRAQQPSKSKKACLQRGHLSCRISSSMCLRAASCCRCPSSIASSLPNSASTLVLYSPSSSSTLAASNSLSRDPMYCRTVSAGSSFTSALSSSALSPHSRGCFGQATRPSRRRRVARSAHMAASVVRTRQAWHVKCPSPHSIPASADTVSSVQRSPAFTQHSRACVLAPTRLSTAVQNGCSLACFALGLAAFSSLASLDTNASRLSSPRSLSAS
mmetsp:Transcript_22532/g.53413  ORF Transcript_22532/g.53413 Transcript_22532/m.53413 type:complete len:313 (-) Transcript_22532:165-1103(-)